MVFALAILMVGAAGAQDAKIRDTVLDRPRPQLDAQGARIGSFGLFPVIGLGLLSDSNIFATETIQIDDLIWLIEPELILKSDWSRHELEVGFDLVAARYSDVSTEDYDDWRVWADTTLDLGRGRLSALARYADLHQPRTSPDNRFGIRPTLYSSAEVNLGYAHPFGQFVGEVEISGRRLEFDDTIRITGPFSNADRDRDRTDLSFRIGHQTWPGLRPFVQLDLTEVVYDQQFDRDGFERSSEGFDVLFGTDVDLTGRMFGEAYVGYVRRDYEDPRFSTVDGPIFGGNITWNATGLTTMIFSADRGIRGTTIVGAAGILNTSLGLEVDHELLRNLILGLEVAFDNEDFQGIERDDDIFRASLDAIYLMNRYLRLRAAYTYQSRDTSPANSGGFEYRVHRLFIGVEGQY